MTRPDPPHAFVRLRLTGSGEGGRKSPLMGVGEIPCVLGIGESLEKAGAIFTVMLFTGEYPQLVPGNEYDIGIFIPFIEKYEGILREGKSIFLCEGRRITARGQILSFPLGKQRESET